MRSERIAVYSRLGVALLAVAAAAGCRELIRPFVDPSPQRFAVGVILTTAGTYAPAASVDMDNSAYVQYPENLSWHGVTNSKGEFVSEVPAGGLYDVHIQYPAGSASTVRNWDFIAVRFDAEPVVLRPEPHYQACRVRLPAAFPGPITGGNCSFYYQFRTPDGGIRTTSSFSYEMDSAGRIVLALPRAGRYDVELSVSTEGGRLHYSWADSLFANLADTLELSPSIVPFQVLTTVHGDPGLALAVSLEAATSQILTGADLSTFNINTVTGAPINAWCTEGTTRIQIGGREHTPIIDARTFALITEGAAISLELGRYRASLRIRTSADLPAGGADIRIRSNATQYSSDDLNLGTDVDGVADCYLNPGVYWLATSFGPSAAVDTVLTVVGDFEATLRLPPSSPR